jgi:DNA-binding NarL/FixJ family response regulator
MGSGAAGLSNVAIGGKLAISPLTVKNHMQKILRKLHVRNRTQAAALEMLNRSHEA